MPTQRYSVTPHPIETLLTWVKSGEVAIPEIQRPFVWDSVKVRNFLDSLYQGYPVGYLIAWRNPIIRLKDGSLAAGKRILIDGQQRVMALMAALLGHEVLTKEYETVRIRIAFHPLEERFEVYNTAIQKDPAWIPDIADVFDPEASIQDLTDTYAERNESADRSRISRVLERLRKITNNHIGFIELAEDLDIETVTEIFIRVNSEGVALSQADFVMSKIAANETYNGSMLRKAIDYFCHLAKSPEFLPRIEKNDQEFARSEFFPRIKWLGSAKDVLYEPSYTDMLRVAFTSRFHRGRLQDLVALLSGRNFETKKYEEEIAEQSFAKLKEGILDFTNKTHFERFTMILRSAGFIVNDLIWAANPVNFAYILYLRGRAEDLDAAQIERIVRRWYVMSVLTGRYTGSPETRFDQDIRQIESRGMIEYTDAVIDAELSSSFWDSLLPQQMDTSSTNSPYFIVFKAAQAKLGDKGFLSSDITVRDLLLNRGDVHHVYPKEYLKNKGLHKVRYNQIANLVVSQSEINIVIGNKPPEVYFKQLREQCNGGVVRYGSITDELKLRENLRMNCIPEQMLDGEVPEYDDFLEMRRHLMADKIRAYYKGL